VDLLVVESDPLPSTSSYSVIEPSPEPGIMEEEEIQPPEFLYRSRMTLLKISKTPRIAYISNKGRSPLLSKSS
jgi:hypothetical protein